MTDLCDLHRTVCWRGISGDACSFNLVARRFRFSAGFTHIPPRLQVLESVGPPVHRENFVRQVLPQADTRNEIRTRAGKSTGCPSRVAGLKWISFAAWTAA
jgi:hypothetical protein